VLLILCAVCREIRIMMIVGVDISKATMDACALTPKGDAPKKCANSPRGADDLYSWVTTQQKRHNLTDGAPLIAMEATGSYHFLVAMILHALGARVAVIPPNRVYAFAKAMGLTSKSDSADARAIAMCAQSLLALGQLQEFTPPPDSVLELRELVKRLGDLTAQIVKERLRLQEHPRRVIWLGVAASLRRSIKWHEAEKKALQATIEDFYKAAAHTSLKTDRALLFTIPGVGPQAADHLICLLRTRELRSAREAAALAGVIPRNKDSGTSVHAPARITKEGDGRVRAGLYLPTMSACLTPAFRGRYQELVARGKPKKSSTIIIEHEIVRASYGMLKHQTPFKSKRASSLALAA
jgi:transposase